MTVTLTAEESEQFFHLALCNGLSQLQGYGIDLSCDNDEYQRARKFLSKSSGPTEVICREDVWMQILRDGGTLVFMDTEDGENPEDGETVTITLADVHEKVAMTPFNHLADMILENDDADTADTILQTVLYGEIIFA